MTDYETAIGCTYVLTSSDVENGRNRLGMDVSHIPLDVALCGFCDTPIDGTGKCESCRTIHLSDLTECVGDPLAHLEPRRAA